MSERDEIAKIAQEFLDLPASAREVFIARLADGGAAPEWIPLLEHFHKNLLKEKR